MAIGEFCNREVIIASKNSTIKELTKLMRQHHVGDVVIVEDKAGHNIPVGIVTDRDIVLELVVEDVDLNACMAGDIMSFELVTVKESDGIWETLQQMRSKGIRRIPVVNEQNALVGIISADDLLELITEEMSDLVKIISRQQRKEREKRA